MAARVSESFVLRTYPFREGDLIVSFFTRDAGKLRGVARRARKPKSPFGSGLERLSQVQMRYSQRENRELVNLVSCEIIHSQFALASRYETALALDYFAEICDTLLPPNEVNEREFRLMASVLEYLREGGSAWAAMNYFTLWSVRLAGFLPDLHGSPESMGIAKQMLTTPVAALDTRAWNRDTFAEVRRFLIRQIEEHSERRLRTVPLLDTL